MRRSARPAWIVTILASVVLLAAACGTQRTLGGATPTTAATGTTAPTRHVTPITSRPPSASSPDSATTAQPPAASTITAPPPATPSATETAYTSPPVLKLHTDDGREYDAFRGSYCWSSPSSDGSTSSSCVDSTGPGPGDLPDVGRAGSVEFDYPLPDTRFEVAFSPVDAGPCDRSYGGRVTDLGDGRFRVEPAGPADRYDVSILGRGPRGESPGRFRWTTVRDGSLPAATGAVGAVAESSSRPGRLVPLGFLLRLEDLASEPGAASATVRVTAADGATYAFDAGPARTDCVGRVVFDGGRDGESSRIARRVSRLGPTPLTYRVEVTLDGETYAGRGVFPGDVTDPDGGSDTALTFTPDLPGLG